SSLQVVLDLTLARGLNYYTGLIFEVSAPKGVELGSIGGGGRYDNLTTHFGGTPMGGVGISFGLDRIYMVLEMLDLFPVEVSDKLDIIVLFYEDSQADAVIPLIAQLRKQGVSIEMYPGEAKLQKQFKYIDKRKARFALYPKPELIAQGKIELKDLENGEVTQFELSHVDQIKKALQ
ncbi:MAG: ATP phosphoribosyltransferase regulatory subunit, partial [Bacteroidetes bacterium]|nr:ATP phosphoribosyltransferase regulatory subunit [Bacteroidota bacterium]